MKDVERSSLAHTLKGDGTEGIVEDMEEKVWILGYKDPKWIWRMEAWTIYA